MPPEKWELIVKANELQNKIINMSNDAALSAYDKTMEAFDDLEDAIVAAAPSGSD